MTSDVLTQYAALQEQINVLEEQKKALRENVLEHLQNQDVEKLEHALGTFSIQRRKSWSYPEEVKAKEEEVKVAKKDAEEQGTATFTETESLRFVSIKI